MRNKGTDLERKETIPTKPTMTPILNWKAPETLLFVPFIKHTHTQKKPGKEPVYAILQRAQVT